MARMKNIHPIEIQRLGDKLEEFAGAMSDRAEYYMNTEEGRDDVKRAAGQAAHLAQKAGDIALAAAGCVVRGGARRIQDYAAAGTHVAHGQYKEAGKVIVAIQYRRLKSAGQLAVEAGKTIGNGAGMAYRHLTHKEMDEAKKKHFYRQLRNCAIAGGAIFLGMELYDGLEHTMGDVVPATDVDFLPGVSDGVLVDDSPEHLQALAASGELDHAEHVDDVVRSPAVRAEFLEMHGMTEVPDGWEVHHVVPLSEGGADSVENMVLLREQDHDWITAQHQRFYGWEYPDDSAR